jgi:hypothetical protein
MPRAQTLDITTVAKLIKLQPRQVQQLTAEGVLHRARDADGTEIRGRYHMVECVHGYIDYLRARTPIEGSSEHEYDKLRTRRMAFESEMAELKLNLLKGTLHRGEDVEFCVTTQITACRSRLLAIPSRVSRLLIGKRSFKEIYNLIYGEIELALRELTGYDAKKFSAKTIEYVESLSEHGTNGEGKDAAAKTD